MCIRHFGVGGQWRTGGVSLTPRHAIAHSKQRNSIITAQYKTALGKQMTKSTFCLNGDRKQYVWARKKNVFFRATSIRRKSNTDRMHICRRADSLSLSHISFLLFNAKMYCSKVGAFDYLNQV